VEVASGANGVAALDDGAPLDGDADDQPGGDFRKDFTVIPGDADHNGEVNALDVAAVRRSLGAFVTADGQAIGPHPWSPSSDLDGSGRIDALDMAATRRAIDTAGAVALSALTPGPALSSDRTNSEVADFFGEEPIV
jgi:hypothetical protein